LTYVVLDRKDGGSFLVVNTHLDNNGDNSHDVAEVIRQAEVDIMMQVVKGVTDARGDIPVIITGDFNVIPNNRTAYNAMTKTYGYFDSRIIKKEGDSANTYTYNGMKDGDGSILDYIFVSRHMQNTVQNYDVCDAKLNGEWISDHNAIISTIAVPYVKRTY
jgi:endonuclease/exonuclease/phosphatase family metal-dependent hydrolase